MIEYLTSIYQKNNLLFCGEQEKQVRPLLIDTLLAYRIEPFKKRQARQVITKSSKYYLFDVGVASYISRRWLTDEKGEQFGKAFEQFLLMEIIAYRSYKNYDFDINFWRTKTGIEVDFILNKGEIAIEIKGKDNIDTGFKKFKSLFRRILASQGYISLQRKNKKSQ